MSVLKSWDTSLQRRERRTLVSFLALYLLLWGTIVALFCVAYIQVEKESMLSAKRTMLNELANEHVKALRFLHANFDKTRVYPRHEAFRSAIYDGSEVEIFSLLHVKPLLHRIIYLKEGMIHYIKEPEAHYLGTQYLVLEVEDDGLWRANAVRNIVIFGSVGLVVLGIGGYFLTRLLLRPMREAVGLLDRFIKDTTHELNTPLHTIVSNIEMIDTKELPPATVRKLQRIRIGAQTVSGLYQDLMYLTLGHNVMSQNEEIRVDMLMQERLEYFALSKEAKKLTQTLALRPATLWMDRQKLAKIMDNILSNAIKYNRIGGALHVKVEERFFEICDTGIGIEPSKLEEVFERYTRLSPQVGGFGIGLSIVGMLAKEYGLALCITSNQGEGTCVRVSW